MMENYDVVKKLIGKIDPVADASIDSQRAENLESFLTLFNEMFLDLHYVAKHRDSPYGSQKGIGERAYKFLQNLKEEI